MTIPPERRATNTLDDWPMDCWLYAYVDDFPSNSGPGSVQGISGLHDFNAP